MVELSEPNACEVDQQNVRNPNKIVGISDVVQNPNDLTTKTKTKSAEIQMFGFRTLTVCIRTTLKQGSNSIVDSPNPDV